MSFQEFTEMNKKQSYFVSITTHNAINFGGDFLEKNNLSDMAYVKLFFDNSNGDKIIGFKFLDSKIEGTAFKLISNTGTRSKSIVARSFWLKFLSNVNVTDLEKRYLPRQIEDGVYGSLWTITLKSK